MQSNRQLAFPLMSVKIRIYLLFILCAPFSAAIHASSIPKAPPCTQKECDITAVPVEWPKPLIGNAVKIQFNGYTLVVPADIELIAPTNDFLLLQYKSESDSDKRRIILTNRKKSEFEFLQHSSFTLFDFANIHFTKTRNDPTPTESEDKIAWEWSIFLKSTQLNAGKVTMSEKGSIVAYVLLRANQLDFDNKITIVNSIEQNQMLTIEVSGFPETIIKGIIGSLQKNN